MLIPLSKLSPDHALSIRGIIHIGAHHGWEFKQYQEAGITNLVFVEPLPSNFEQLQKNVGPECLLFNTALGNYVGEAEMHVDTANMGQSSSILEPGTHLDQYPHITFETRVKVPVTKLDLLPFNRPDFNMLNIDVQGYELEVLKGGEDTLRGIDVLYLEVSRVELYKGCVQIGDLDAWLLERGFVRTRTEWIGGGWGDALYLRSRPAEA